jgi:hypothetical protein
MIKIIKMSTEFKQELYIEALRNLPEKIQDVLNKSNWEKELINISRTHRLRIDQTAIVEGALKNLMVGITDVNGFFEDISDLGLEVNVFEALMDEIEVKIMQVLKDKIIIATGGNQDDGTEHSRDSILAEIENEELDARPLASNIVMPGNRTMPGASMETTSVSTAPTTSGTAPISIPVEHREVVTASSTTSTGVEDRLGLRGGTSASMPVSPKPFTLGQDTDPSVQVSISRPELAMGVQSDPVTSGLTKPTMTTAPASQPGQGARVVDPYREPIE